MKFQPRKPEDPAIDIASLIDVVFILLIFFMVTTTFQRESQLKISLPEASNAPVAAEQKPLMILIDAHGNYQVGDLALSNNQAATLKTALQELTAGRENEKLIIRADANTPHQYVVTAMDVAAQLGLLQLSIATTPDESAGGEESQQ